MWFTTNVSYTSCTSTVQDKYLETNVCKLYHLYDEWGSYLTRVALRYENIQNKAPFQPLQQPPKSSWLRFWRPSLNAFCKALTTWWSSTLSDNKFCGLGHGYCWTWENWNSDRTWSGDSSIFSWGLASPNLYCLILHFWRILIAHQPLSLQFCLRCSQNLWNRQGNDSVSLELLRYWCHPLLWFLSLVDWSTNWLVHCFAVDRCRRQ